MLAFSTSLSYANSESLYIVVTLPAGSTNDIHARKWAKQYDEIYGTSSIVINKPGAEGTIGIKYFLSLQDNDVNGIPVLWPATGHAAGYTGPDVSPLIETSKDPLILIVKKDLPVNSWKEWIDYNKANPGKVSQGATGGRSWFGVLQHINAYNNIQPNTIFYPGRTDIDVASGVLDAGWQLPSSIFGSGIESRIKIIAMTSETKPKDVDVPIIGNDPKVGPWYLRQGFYIRTIESEEKKKMLFERLNSIRGSAWAKENIERNGTILGKGSSEDFAKNMNEYRRKLAAGKAAEEKMLNK